MNGNPLNYNLNGQSSTGLSNIQQAINAQTLNIRQDLNMNGFKIINLGNGTQQTDAINLSQNAGGGSSEPLNEIQNTLPLTGNLDLRTSNYQVLVNQPTQNSSAIRKQDLDTATSNLQDQIDQEILDRQAEDTNLQNQIDALNPQPILPTFTFNINPAQNLRYYLIVHNLGVQLRDLDVKVEFTFNQDYLGWVVSETVLLNQNMYCKSFQDSQGFMLAPTNADVSNRFVFVTSASTGIFARIDSFPVVEYEAIQFIPFSVGRLSIKIRPLPSTASITIPGQYAISGLDVNADLDFRTTGYTTKLDAPIDPEDAANKSYIDTVIQPLSTTEYVDDQIDAVYTSLSDYATIVQLNSAQAGLQNQIDTLDTDLATETTNRINADNTLTTNLSNEVTARTDADTALDARIDALELTEDRIFNGTTKQQANATNIQTTISGTLRKTTQMAAGQPTPQTQEIYPDRMNITSNENSISLYGSKAINTALNQLNYQGVYVSGNNDPNANVITAVQIQPSGSTNQCLALASGHITNGVSQQYFSSISNDASGLQQSMLLSAGTPDSAPTQYLFTQPQATSLGRLPFEFSAKAGYRASSAVTVTDNNQFATKQYVDTTAGSAPVVPTYTQTINPMANSTVYTITHNLNTALSNLNFDYTCTFISATNGWAIGNIIRDSFGAYERDLSTANMSGLALRQISVNQIQIVTGSRMNLAVQPDGTAIGGTNVINWSSVSLSLFISPKTQYISSSVNLSNVIPDANYSLTDKKISTTATVFNSSDLITRAYGDSVYLSGGAANLNAIPAPIASYSFGSQKLTDLALCTNSNDAARKGYVDSGDSNLQSQINLLGTPTALQSSSGSGWTSSLTMQNNGILVLQSSDEGYARMSLGKSLAGIRGPPFRFEDPLGSEIAWFSQSGFNSRFATKITGSQAYTTVNQNALYIDQSCCDTGSTTAAIVSIQDTSTSFSRPSITTNRQIRCTQNYNASSLALNISPSGSLVPVIPYTYHSLIYSNGSAEFDLYCPDGIVSSEFFQYTPSSREYKKMIRDIDLKDLESVNLVEYQYNDDFKKQNIQTGVIWEDVPERYRIEYEQKKAVQINKIRDDLLQYCLVEIRNLKQQVAQLQSQ